MGFSLKKLISKPLEAITKPFEAVAKIDQAVRGVVGGVIGQVGKRLSQTDAVQREIGRDAFEGMRPRFEMGQRRRRERDDDGVRERDGMRGQRGLERTFERFFKKLERLLEQLGGARQTTTDPRQPDRIRLSPIETGRHDEPRFRL